MKWRRRLAWIIGAVCALWILQGVALRATLAFARIPLGMLAYLMAPVYDLAHYPRLRADNDALRQRVALLTQQAANHAALAAENTRLRSLLELREAAPASQLIVARVIARDPTHWTRAVLINKGQRHRLALGTPVVAASGVVGKIVEVHPTTSLVLLVTNPEVRVGATVARTRDQGIAVGDGQWHLRLMYLPLSTEAAAGDDVVTSGAGGLFPSGLSLGHIVQVELDPSHLYRVALIEPSARLGQLEEVACLVNP